MLKMLHIFFQLQLLTCPHTNSPILMFFKIHVDMTAVTIQSKKIVLNEVKDNLALLEPSYGRKQKKFLANPINKGEVGARDF